MLYTAAIMMCLKDVDHSYKTCQIVNGEFKFHSEEQCWSAINGKLATLLEYPEIDYIYEPAYAKCISWLPMTENTNGL